MALGLSWGGLISSIPFFLLAVVFVRTWVRPFAYRERTVRYLVYLMVLEFFVVHSSAALGGTALGDMDGMKKTLILLGLLVFYFLFTGALSWTCKSPWPLISFWGLTLSKLYSYVFDPPTVQAAESMKASWAFMTAAYLLGAFASVLLPIPRLGITADVVARQHFTASGLWIEQPQRAVAFGTVYFTLLGVFELLVHG